MQDNVVKIRPHVERIAADEAVPEIVAGLERLLDDARSGRIRSIAVATEVWIPEEHGCGCGTLWHRGEGGNMFALLGGLTYLRDDVSGAIA